MAVEEDRTAEGRWTVEHITGPASELHRRPWPDPVKRTVWVLRVERPALVLGSTQTPDVVDRDAAARAGVEVVQRRSGGGAVLLVPGESTWVDLVIPSTDPLWEPDVGRAFHWLGALWRSALTTPGGALAHGVEVNVHRGPLMRNRWSGLVCFAGLGAGEVTVRQLASVPGASGPPKKLVGLSQRRTRHGARFQAIVHHRWDPAAVLALLRLDPLARRQGERDLAGAVATWGGDPERLLALLLQRLPAH